MTSDTFEHGTLTIMTFADRPTVYLLPDGRMLLRDDYRRWVICQQHKNAPGRPFVYVDARYYRGQ